MNRVHILDKKADTWSSIYTKTHRYDALENAKEARKQALLAGASPRCKRRVKAIRARGR